VIQRQRRSASAAKAQTRAYAERLDELVPVLRAEVPAPARPNGAPILVVLMGQPGVGKSHCARLLSARLDAAHLSSDHLRSRLFIAASYAPEESATIFAAMSSVLDLLLREGHRVVLDATNLLARHRDASISAARRRSIPIVHVRVTADEAETLARLAHRRLSRGEDDHSDADETIYRKMSAFEPPDGGHLELRNGPALAAEVDRIVAEVEARCGHAS